MRRRIALRALGRATAQAPVKLKMQASWPAASTFMDSYGKKR